MLLSTDLGSTLLVIAIVIATDLICFWAGIYPISIRRVCKEQIQASYVGCKTIYAYRHISYAPEFSYTYQGQEYRSRCLENFTSKRINDKFQYGKSYPVFINPDKPQKICIGRRPLSADILLILIGIGIFAYLVVIIKVAFFH